MQRVTIYIALPENRGKLCFRLTFYLNKHGKKKQKKKTIQRTTKAKGEGLGLPDAILSINLDSAYSSIMLLVLLKNIYRNDLLTIQNVLHAYLPLSSCPGMTISHQTTPSQSLLSGHPPAWYFGKPIYGNYKIFTEIMTQNDACQCVCLVRALNFLVYYSVWTSIACVVSTLRLAWHASVVKFKCILFLF